MGGGLACAVFCSWCECGLRIRQKGSDSCFCVSVAALRLVFSWGVMQEERCITGNDFPAHLKCWCFESLCLLKHGELRRPHVSAIRGERPISRSATASETTSVQLYFLRCFLASRLVWTQWCRLSKVQEPTLLCSDLEACCNTYVTAPARIKPQAPGEVH